MKNNLMRALLFDNPRYIHLGMDEEDAMHAAWEED